MAVQSVLFVHGYSETSLGTYNQFPRLLSEAGLNVQPIALSAFDSLDDVISIADLAASLEDHVQRLEGAKYPGWNTAGAAVICHSTGALVVRRWILDRIANDRAIPSHLITMAGANHGSSLAQAGKSVLGYLQKLLTKHLLTVGARVLTDLDYGSDFLLKLNEEWLNAWNDPASPLSRLYAFSMGGDWIGSDPIVKIFWGSCEVGSDNTVRISGANLNYRFIWADSTGKLRVTIPARPVPHAVLTGYSHFGNDSGIVGKATDKTDEAFRHVLQALQVDEESDYEAVLTDWQTVTGNWSASADKKDDVNATIVFNLVDRGLQPIADCMIAFLDSSAVSDPANPLADAQEAKAATNAVSSAINDHSPIHNNVQLGSYSFYINWPKWEPVNHLLHIEAHSPGARIGYKPIDYQIPPEIGKLVCPNEFTYVKLTLESDTEGAYALYGYGPTLEPLSATTWQPDQPFPMPGQIP
jgi:hypothetical protein